MEVRGVHDIFTPPTHIAVIPRYLDAKAAATADGRRLSIDKAAQALGVGRMTIKRAKDYLRRMEMERTTELYRELHARPDRASRWKPRTRKD
jgi:GNAT superfamily N-acetyltransferase